MAVTKQQQSQTTASARMVQLACRVPATTAARVQRDAERKHRDVSWVLRQLLVAKYGR